jgi:hypothetical protein
MDLQSRKITFVQEFLRIQDEEIVSELEKLLRKEKTELYEKTLIPMSIEQFNNEIDQSLSDSQQEKIVSAQDLKNKAQKWS